MFDEVNQIKFLGGPLDGHTQTLRVPLEQLVEIATFPINRNFFRLMNRHPAGKPHPVTSVAVYRLVRENGELTYLFQHAEAPVVAQQ